MSRHRVEHGAWCATVGARLPVTANGKRIGTALVCDDGSLLVEIDDSELAQVIDSDARGMSAIDAAADALRGVLDAMHPPADVND